MALSPQHRHSVRLILDLGCGAQLGVEETRRDDVDSGKVSPLSRKTLAKV